MSRRRAVVAGLAAAGLATSSLVATAAPAAATETPCIVVSLDDQELLRVCEYVVETESCPDGEAGIVLVFATGGKLSACAAKIET